MPSELLTKGYIYTYSPPFVHKPRRFLPYSRGRVYTKPTHHPIRQRKADNGFSFISERRGGFAEENNQNYCMDTCIIYVEDYMYINKKYYQPNSKQALF